MAGSFKFGISVCVGALLAVGLTACGGGGGGDTPQTSTPSSNVGSTSGYYTVAESRNGSSAPSTLSVVDPADPTHPKLTVTVDGQGRDYYKVSMAGSVDSVARIAHITGEPLLIYVKSGALYQVDLRASASATSVRISSESHVCQIADIHPVALSGYDAWVEVRTAGVDGNCTATTDNRTVLVRTNTSATTGGTLLPTTSTLVGSFGNGAAPSPGRLLILEAAGSSTKLRLYSAEMTPGNYVTGSDGAHTVEHVYVSTAVGQPARYYIVDKQLKQFTTDGSTASLSPSLYTFTTVSTGVVNAAGDTAAIYFVDDAKVMRVAGSLAATPLATLNTSNTTYSILQTPTHLVFSQGNAISAIPKSGGTVTTLKTGSQVAAFGASGTQVTYFFATGGANGSGEFRSINTNGTNDTLIEGGVIFAGGFMNATFAFDGSTPMFKSLVYCIPRNGDTDCRNGTLKAMDAATHATMPLGAFHTSTPLAFFYIDPVVGIEGYATHVMATGATSSGTRLSDAYFVAPGSTNSLARVTNLVP